MRSRRADAVLFGFDFQRNAAIVLMLENIKNFQSLRLEGNDQDIELTMQDGKRILAQAKAVVKSSSDFSHVRENLKNALTSLSDVVQDTNVEQLVFITNSTNPFNDNASRSIFWAPTRRQFSTLPPSAQKIVENYLSKIAHPLDLNKFYIQFFQFETDDEAERYKVVQAKINDFIGELNTNISPGLGKKLLQVWHENIFVNGSKKDVAIQLEKKDIVWPIIVLETDINHCDDSIVEQFDTGIYDEVVRLYGEMIDSCCERMDFFTRVLFDYNQFQSSKKPREKCLDFVEHFWCNYQSEFNVQGIDGEILEALTKIILYNIVHRRIVIDNIKRGVNL